MSKENANEPKPTMVYKKGGSEEIKGFENKFSTKIIDAKEVASAEKEGWRCSPEEASKAKAPKKTEDQ